MDKKKLMTYIVPIGLIVLILIFSLIAAAVKKNGSAGKTEAEIDQLQESIMDYTDDQIGITKETGDSSQAEMLITSPEPTEAAMPTATPASAASPIPTATAVQEKLYQNVEYEIENQLGEMMAYWAGNNQKALDDLAFLERFKAMSYSLIGTNDYYYYGEEDAAGTPNGTGIAVYADNKYYYGTWTGGKRSGEGIFLHYHIHEEAGSKDVYSYHFYSGEWKNDLPEGKGTEHYEFNMHNLQKGIGYNSNLIGAYKEGLYNGDFYITNVYSDGNVKEWDATAETGVFVYQNANKDKVGRRTVQVDRTDANNYIWMSPKDNKNLGVQCMNVSGKRN